MATPTPSPTPTLLAAVANATAAVLLNASAAATQAPQPSAAAMVDPAAAAGLQTLPPMPEPPIFDAPFNPYYGALAQAMQGMNDTQKMQFQPFIVAQILEASRNKSMDQSRIVIGGYALVLLFCLVLLAYIRHNRQRALKGDSEATRKIILPAFEPMLWFLAALTTAYVVFFTATISADFITVKSSLVTVEFIYATKQFLYLFVPIYMLQKSLSVTALARAALITFAVSVYSIPFTWLMYTYGKDHQRVCYFANQIIHWLTFIPMFYYCLHPPSRASKRAIREYAVYYFVTHMLYLASMEAFRQGSVNDSMTLSWVTVGWNATCPFFIWRLLKADTEHWRGMGKRAVELQTRFRRKGKVEERISAKGLHVLIELHRKYIIDFASLDIQHKISEAETAMVFRGKLSTKQLPVAIKVYTPETFDEDTVAEYSHEAALCGALHHPNIVTFYGMCVCPPTICLVTELCQGSLKDITRSMARKTVQTTHRQQFLINIGYMIDAARAIAYLHSFSPAFVHRDIKPGSFLVDAEGSVKLTDFGASRTLSARSASGHQHEHEAPAASVAAAAMATMQENGKKKVLTNAGLGAGLAEIMGNLRGNPEYMAPEVIRSKNAGTSKYGEAADIYALAMTMWDILYPNESKYNSTVRTVSSTQSGDAHQQLNRRESEVFECVFAGQRPFLDERMYPPLRELIQTAWHPDPRLRPSAQNIVHVLETIQEETCAVYALELIESLECGAAHAALKAAKPGVAHPPKSITDVSQISFAGSRAIEKMYALEHIAAESEAVRLGNMLLDAGFLHHIKHARSFEYSAALYFFDEEQIHLCQPLAMLEEGAVSTEQDHQAGDGGRPRYAQQASARLARPGGGRHARHSDTSSSHHQHHLHAHAGRRGRQDSSQQGSNVLMDNMTGLMCTCRKLGQKLESAQTTRRRLRLKFKSSDENLVTARLLADEPMAEFGDFPDNAYNSMGRLA